MKADIQYAGCWRKLCCILLEVMMFCFICCGTIFLILEVPDPFFGWANGGGSGFAPVITSFYVLTVVILYCFFITMMQLSECRTTIAGMLYGVYFLNSELEKISLVNCIIKYVLVFILVAIIAYFISTDDGTNAIHLTMLFLFIQIVPLKIKNQSITILEFITKIRVIKGRV